MFRSEDEQEEVFLDDSVLDDVLDDMDETRTEFFSLIDMLDRIVSSLSSLTKFIVPVKISLDLFLFLISLLHTLQ